MAYELETSLYQNVALIYIHSFTICKGLFTNNRNAYEFQQITYVLQNIWSHISIHYNMIYVASVVRIQIVYVLVS